MAGLPAASAAFTGRGSDMDEVLRLLAPRRPREGETGDATAADEAGVVPVVVTVITGMGGIGKTEVAVQAAHAAFGRGWFPGGVLFADMFGYDPSRRLTAAQAAAGFVRALGIPGEHVPTDAQDVERLLRSVLDAYARLGRPVLIVIDNVSDLAQVAPLLPAHPDCRTIVTSRHTMALLGTRIIDLGTGTALQEVHWFDEAMTAQQQAAPIFRDSGDRPSEELVLNDLQETTEAQDSEPEYLN
jgi:hypothetical protein